MDEELVATPTKGQGSEKNPFQSPKARQERDPRKRSELVFWGIAAALLIGCGLLFAWSPILGVVIAVPFVLPGLANSYLEMCFRRDFDGSAYPVEQLRSVVIGFAQLIPLVALAVLIHFGTIEVVVANARATMPGGAEAWDVMGGAVLGLMIGLGFYVLGTLALLGWKLGRIRK